MQTYLQLLLAVVCAMFLAACSGWQPGSAQTDTMTPQVTAVAHFKATDPSLERFFKEAYGYAVYFFRRQGRLLDWRRLR
ncbi:MAG TPA: hypothetical protein VNF46_01270 [Gammaproteobacteria bacterium]|nr:hypothetical protein [Gammaproteobacteria bacterium]